jgi:hypothetical protein
LQDLTPSSPRGAAIDSEQQAKELADIVGPKYRKFKKQVIEYDVPAR